MKIEHHVGEELLLAYGAGTLDEATSLLVATHLALCPACRADLDLAETIGGVLIDRTKGAVPADEGILEAAASTPDNAVRTRQTSDRASLHGRCGAFVLPQPLRDYAGGDCAGLAWRAVGGGIRKFALKTSDAGATALLLSISAGQAVPDHGHRGFEATLVLAGSFYDRGSWYRRGDVEIADQGIVHQPIAGPEEDCICLVVTDARVKFRTLIPRLLQPFHGI